MSIKDVHTEERTPAPAGSTSRILDFDEAQRIGVAPWMVEELDAPPSRTDAVPSAPSLPAPDFDRLERQHRQDLQAAVDQARREVEARFQARLEGEVEPWLRRMAASIEDVATVKRRYLAESEEKVVRLAIAIARRLLHREIQVDPLALQGLLRAAIDKSELREVNRILLHADDLDALRPHLATLNLPPRIELASDRSLERGALVIESSSGSLDASLASQLDEVERGFIDLLGKRS